MLLGIKKEPSVRLASRFSSAVPSLCAVCQRFGRPRPRVDGTVSPGGRGVVSFFHPLLHKPTSFHKAGIERHLRFHNCSLFSGRGPAGPLYSPPPNRMRLSEPDSGLSPYLSTTVAGLFGRRPPRHTPCNESGSHCVWSMSDFWESLFPSINLLSVFGGRHKDPRDPCPEAPWAIFGPVCY